MISVPKQMSLGDVVKATILLKRGNIYFKEEALAYGFKKTSETKQRFRELFRDSCDGSSPEHNTILENTLSFMQIGRFLQHTGDWQYMYMTKFGRDATRQHLRESYGGEILDKIKPIVEQVWKYALEYR